MAIQWIKELSVGNEIIDSEHRDLIGLVNDVAHAIWKRDCATLAQTLEILENRLHAHFVNEEKIARAAGFDFSGHKSAQQYSLKELRQMRVPRDFLRIHQLVIAGLFASSHLLDLSKSFDPNVAMDLQKTVLQEQNYQVQVIQKIQIELTTESMRLQDKYPELTAKYAEVLEISN